MKFGVGGSVGGVRAGVSGNSRGVGGGVGAGPFHLTGGSGSSGGGDFIDEHPALSVVGFLCILGAIGAAIYALLIVLAILLLLLPTLLIGGSLFARTRKNLQKPLLVAQVLGVASVLVCMAYGIIWAFGWPDGRGYSTLAIAAPLIRGGFLAIDVPTVILGTSFLVWFSIKKTRRVPDTAVAGAGIVIRKIQIPNVSQAQKIVIPQGLLSALNSTPAPVVTDAIRLESAATNPTQSKIEIDDAQKNCSFCDALLDTRMQKRHQSGQPWLCDVCKVGKRKSVREQLQRTNERQWEAFPEDRPAWYIPKNERA